MLQQVEYIPYEEFISKFASAPEVTPASREGFKDFNWLTEEVAKSAEKKWYHLLCDTLSSTFTGSKLGVFDTAQWPEGRNDKSIDLSIMPKLARRPVEVSSSPTFSLREPYASYMSWVNVAAFMEVKNANNSHPFSKSQGDEALRALGQIVEYASRIQNRQHRVFLFSISIRGTQAWLVRWDRAGLVVSEPFDFHEHPHMLLDFVYKLAHMTPSELGFDTAVSDATPEEVEQMRTYQPTVRAHQKYLKDAISDPEYPIKRVTVQTGDKSKDFLIGKPHSPSHSTTGRSTKGFIALDIADQRLVYLKDSWRIDSPKYNSEVDTYRRLSDAQVPYIATMICGGDVGTPAQRTVTQDIIYSKQSSKGRPYHALIHCRLVTKQIGLPLGECVSSWYMCKAIYNAILAHQAAWKNAGILHHDISYNNILIDSELYKNGTGTDFGFLNDWDLCKTKEQLNKQATAKVRSGTWVFLSALAVNYPLKPYSVSDDIESFVHVTKWTALRFLPHSIEQVHLLGHIQAEYEADKVRDGYRMGPFAKWDRIQLASPGFRLDPVACSHSFISLIKRLMTICQEHYRTIDEGGIQKYKPKTENSRVFRSVSDSADSLDEDEVQNTPQAQPLLNDHDAITKAFSTALAKKTWIDDHLDGWDAFKGLKFGELANLSTGSKRASQDDLSHGRKRSRTGSEERSSSLGVDIPPLDRASRSSGVSTAPGLDTLIEVDESQAKGSNDGHSGM